MHILSVMDMCLQFFHFKQVGYSNIFHEARSTIWNSSFPTIFFSGQVNIVQPLNIDFPSILCPCVADLLASGNGCWDTMIVYKYNW